MWQVDVPHISEMAGPSNRGDTIINKHFTLLLYFDELTNVLNGRKVNSDCCCSISSHKTSYPSATRVHRFAQCLGI